MKYKVALIACFLFFITSSFVYALEDIFITFDPESPEPYSTVTVIADSYAMDLNTTLLIWKVAGKEVLRGMGERKIRIPLQGVGTSIPVSVTASSFSGQVIETTLSLSPQSVDIIWEVPESYVPPFYEGRSLPGLGATVKVTALPNMSNGNTPFAPSALSYVWYVNDEVIDSASGAGKQSANIPLDILRDESVVSVKVRSATGLLAEKRITLYPHEIMPLVYTYDPLLGVDMSKLVLRRLEITGDTILSLQPFYLSKNTVALSQSTNYLWFLDGLPVTPEGKTLFALRPKENSSGMRTLLIQINNTKRKLQQAETSLQILFDTRK